MSLPRGPYQFVRRHWSELQSLPRGRFTFAAASISHGMLLRLKWYGLIRRASRRAGSGPDRGNRYATWEATGLFWSIAERIRREQA